MNQIVFFEIYFKSLKYKKFKSAIILIASHNLIKLQMKKLNVKKKIKIIEFLDLKNIVLTIKNKFDKCWFWSKKPFEKISINQTFT